jgi:hypothetical protein
MPPGAYHVEARDNDYTFYQAPGRISLGRKKGYSDQTDHAFDGGIFISRNAHAKYPSGAYTDLKNGKMLLLLFFDSRFARQEGKQWHYEE